MRQAKATKKGDHVREGISITPRGTDIRKFYFLIHPLTYAPECADGYGNKKCYRIYRKCENEVRRRYHQAIDTMEEDAALAICPTLYSEDPSLKPEELIDIEVMARRKLGSRLLIMTYPTTSSEFLKLCKQQGLTYDPQTVRSEGWGESFDGCVAKYCTMFSKQLGLAKPIEQNFAMCVPDLIWLIRSKFIEKVSLPSEIRFYLFEGEDSQPMAIFFDAYSVPGDLPRSVDVPLDPSNAEFYEYSYVASLSLTPMTKITTPDGKGVRLPISTDLADPPRRAYLLGKDVDVATFRAALVKAEVVE